MRWNLFALIIPMLAACNSTPKVSDGISGYILTNTSAGLLVTYSEEASAGNTTLTKIAQVCAQQLDTPVEVTDLTIKSHRTYNQELHIQILVPVTSGPVSLNAPFTPSQQTESQRQEIPSVIKFQEIAALCPSQGSVTGLD
ncbi:MAG: hypothetical protein R3276_07070 [Marinobacter sp.]|nr:hypothetical protein [Marinobacter sp.]